MDDVVLYLLIASNLIAFALMGIDKHKAKHSLRRIPEKVLFLFPVLFGAMGGTLGMYVFRHKTRHWYFEVFFPALVVVQVVITGLLQKSFTSL